MDNTSFRNLDSQEENDFRLWARCNHKPGSEIKDIWHPVVREECEQIDWEHYHKPLFKDSFRDWDFWRQEKSV